eukprot:TRINITY_DN6197_c2_g1_i1.p1 TRINITY_DN6197_c2_g1~~TRINITY_DN6197_c2_g1_i1.p1  ORF type:complete len:658 (-),score=75.97 TRINITY_DN6197_c2_g1_i1:179-2152(-)
MVVPQAALYTNVGLRDVQIYRRQQAEDSGEARRWLPKAPRSKVPLRSKAPHAVGSTKTDSSSDFSFQFPRPAAVSNAIQSEKTSSGSRARIRDYGSVKTTPLAEQIGEVWTSTPAWLLPAEDGTGVQRTTEYPKNKLVQHFRPSARQKAEEAGLFHSPTALRRLSNSVSNAGRQHQWEKALELLWNVGCKMSLEVDTPVLNAAVNSCARADRWTLALDTAQKARENGFSLNTITHNILIKAAANSHHWLLALNFLLCMFKPHQTKTMKTKSHPSGTSRQGTLSPDEITYNAAMSACAQSGGWLMAQKLLKTMAKSMVESSQVSYGAAISACVGAAAWRRGLHVLFDGHFQLIAKRLRQESRLWTSSRKAESKAKSRKPEGMGTTANKRSTTTTVNIAISACGEASSWQSALQTVVSARDKSVLHDPDLLTCNTLAMSCLRGHAWAWGLEVLDLARRWGLRPDPMTACAAFSTCETSQQWKVATAVMQALRVGEEGGLEPDLVLYNAAIAAMGKSPRWYGALQVLDKMRQHKIRHDLTTCTAAVRACTTGASWDLAFSLLDEMRCGMIQPNALTYDSAIASCVPGRHWEEGLYLFGRMQSERRLRWTVLCCESLIKVCQEAGQPGKVRFLLDLVRRKRDWSLGRRQKQYFKGPSFEDV